MPITELQKEQRRKHVGSSDLAAILGVSPWNTAEDIRLQKVGLDEGPKETPNMRLGTMMEPTIMAMAELELGSMKRNQYRIVEGLPMGMNIDAIIDSNGNPVEGKTGGIIRGFVTAAEWGDAGTDQVPDYVNVQCQGHMMATKKDICHVPTILGGRGFVMFLVPFSQEIADVIAEKVQEFWTVNVVGDTPCKDILPSMPVIKRLKRSPGKMADVDIELYRQWKATKTVMSEAKKLADEAKHKLIAAFGDAEGTEIAGEGTLTYMTTKRKGFTVEPTEFRQLRLKK